MALDLRPRQRRICPSGRIRRLTLVLAVVLGLTVGAMAPMIVGFPSTATAGAATSTSGQSQEHFTVRITTTNSPVVENETLDVFVTVENEGNESGTQTVKLFTDGVVREKENVTLQPGKSDTVKLSWQTTEGDAGKYVARVESENDSDSTPVTVQHKGGVPIESCTIIDEPGKYVLNETIRNRDNPDCIRIRASNVTLNGEGFTINGVDEDSGSVGVNVSTSKARRNVTVRNFTVTGWETGIALGTDRKLTRSSVKGINATENEKGLNVTNGQNNRFRHNVFRNNTNAVLLVGSSGNTFENTTIRNNTGFAISTVPSDDEERSGHNTFTKVDLGIANASLAFEVRDARLAAVDSSAAPSPPPDTFDIGVFLNATTTDSNGYVDLTVNYRDSAVENIAESTLSLWRYDGNWTDVGGTLDTGDNTLTKNITSFSVFAPLSSEPRPKFDVNVETTTSPVTAGEDLKVIATVRNTGERTGTQTVVLKIGGGTVRDETALTLEPEEQKTITLVWDTGSGDTGTYTATVASDNDSDSTNVTVEQPNQPPDAAIRHSPNAPRPGESVLIAATGSSDPDGNIASYEWQIDGEVVSTSESFEHTFESGGTYAIRLKVTDDDGATATATATIEVSTETPTSTPTLTQTTDETPGRTVPGFGLAAALVALLGGALLARRREIRS